MLNKLKLDSFNIGETKNGNLLLLSVEERKTSKNDPFCILKLTDGVKTIDARMFKISASQLPVDVKTVVTIIISANEFNGNISYIVNNISNAELGDNGINEFIPKPPVAPQIMYDYIISVMRAMPDQVFWFSLGKLVERIYEANEENILHWAAGKSIHHNTVSGLLYHTYRMLKAAESIIPIYLEINMQLLFAAVALHDIEKLRELYTDGVGNTSYTLEGELFGRSLLGIRMIDEFADNNFEDDIVMCLKHCIASHHGTKECGAIVTPHILEAQVLHSLDSMDAKNWQYEQAYKDTNYGEETKDKVFGYVYNPTFKSDVKNYS